LYPAAVASIAVANATLERQNAEFIDNCCEQAKALIEPFKAISVLGKWPKNRLSVEVLVT
jgi:hypothetical protein